MVRSRRPRFLRNRSTLRALLLLFLVFAVDLSDSLHRQWRRPMVPAFPIRDGVDVDADHRRELLLRHVHRLTERANPVFEHRLFAEGIRSRSLLRADARSQTLN